MKRILVVTSKKTKFEALGCYEVYFTKSSKYEEDKPTLISWAQILFQKVEKKFDIICIVHSDIFLSESDIFDKRRIDVLLTLLKDDGVIWLSDLSLVSHIDFDVCFQNTVEVFINDKWCSLNEYGKTKKIDSIEHKINVENRELNYISIPSGQFTCKSITVEKFRLLIEDNEFLENMVNSQKKLLDHKRNFYSRLLAETKTKFSFLQKKITFLKTKNIPDAIIREKYPNYEFYAINIAEIQCLIDIISEKEISLEKTKHDLYTILNDAERGLSSLIGRDDIKNNLVTKLVAFSRNYRFAINIFHNMALMGAAGMGKTAIAKMISFVYSKSGLLVTDHIKIVSRADLVGSFVGQTAPRTKGTLMECLEGVLFIDEAHQFVDGQNNKDYGAEAISEIVNFLDKYIGTCVLIVAGYEEPMKMSFFPSNEGLDRRFPEQIVLSPYNEKELTYILLKFLEDKLEETLSSYRSDFLFSCITLLGVDSFPNMAGDMLNIGNIILTHFLIFGWDDESIFSLFQKYVSSKHKL